MKLTGSRLRFGAGNMPEEASAPVRTVRAAGLGAALLAATWVLPAGAMTPAWPQQGYDAGNTGYNKNEAVIDVGNAAGLAYDTILRTPDQNPPEQPVILNGVIYIWTAGNTLTAFQQSSGVQLWSVPLQTVNGPPNGLAIAGDRILADCVLSSGNEGICALSAKTGKPVWSISFTGSVGSQPVISGKTAYFHSSECPQGQGEQCYEYINAVDVKTGKQIWQTGYCENGNCVRFSVNTPAVANGMVYVGCDGSSANAIFNVIGVCALDASTGQFVWNQQMGSDVSPDPNGFVSAQGGKLYIAYQTYSCYQCQWTVNVMVRDGATGATLSDTALGAAISWAPVGAPALGPGGTIFEALTCYCSTPNEPNLFALDQKGKIKWSTTTVALGAPPTVVGEKGKDVLAFACGGNTTGSTCVYDARTGGMLWNSTDNNSDPIAFSPVVTGGVIYNTCYSNNICEYAPQ